MDREKLESAAPTYSYLRGLLAAPAGILCVAAALGNWEVEPFTHAGVMLACLLLVGGLCLAINRYYNEHYGHITASSGQQARAAAAMVIGLVVMIAISMIARSRAGISLDLPVNALGAGWAAFMLIGYAMTVGLSRHHVVIFGGMLLASLAPAWGGLSLGDTTNVGMLLAGAAITAAGICDHRQLVRRLGPAGALSVENGNARA
ncbi:MAG: hypothetical protein QOI73_1923 [Solirubrobacteraceae bacterium]|nr:hypothetical protein [Solirubrobacteraceae bacterium]